MPDDEITIDVSGLEELDAKLDGIAEKLKRSQLRNAAAAGAMVIRAAVEDFAPMRTDDRKGGTALPPGALKNDIHVTLAPHRDDKGITAHVGPGAKTGHVANWLENGHRIVTHGYNKKGKGGPGRVVGFAAAHPFMRPAADSSAQPALDAFVEQLAAELEADSGASNYYGA
jgi:HK97 gp10 family phage protein